MHGAAPGFTERVREDRDAGPPLPGVPLLLPSSALSRQEVRADCGQPDGHVESQVRKQPPAQKGTWDPTREAVSPSRLQVKKAGKTACTRNVRVQRETDGNANYQGRTRRSKVWGDQTLRQLSMRMIPAWLKSTL